MPTRYRRVPEAGDAHGSMAAWSVLSVGSVCALVSARKSQAKRCAAACHSDVSTGSGLGGDAAGLTRRQRKGCRQTGGTCALVARWPGRPLAELRAMDAPLSTCKSGSHPALRLHQKLSMRHGSHAELASLAGLQAQPCARCHLQAPWSLRTHADRPRISDQRPEGPRRLQGRASGFIGSV